MCVCAEVGEQGKKKGRGKSKTKQPKSKDMWFSSCGWMQGLGGLSKALSPDCGTVKDWVGPGRVLGTKSQLRVPCPGVQAGSKGVGVSTHLWNPTPGHRLLVYPESWHLHNSCRSSSSLTGICQGRCRTRAVSEGTCGM